MMYIKINMPTGAKEMMIIKKKTGVGGASAAEKKTEMVAASTELIGKIARMTFSDMSEDVFGLVFYVDAEKIGYAKTVGPHEKKGINFLVEIKEASITTVLGLLNRYVCKEGAMARVAEARERASYFFPGLSRY